MAEKEREKRLISSTYRNAFFFILLADKGDTKFCVEQAQFIGIRFRRGVSLWRLTWGF